MKFIYLGQCDLEQYELEDFLATGKDLEVSGLIEDVYFKKYKEDVVENRIHETKKINSNNTELDNATMLISPKKEEIEDIPPSKQQESIHLGCNDSQYMFSPLGGIGLHNQSEYAALRYNCDQCDSNYTTQHNLIKHKQSKHEGVKYNCNQCDSKFGNRSSVTIHKKSKHE